MVMGLSIYNEPPETFYRISVKSLNNSDLLFLYHQHRSPEVRNELVKRYVPVIEKLAEKYANSEIGYEDICLVALRGLKNAIDRFGSEELEFTGFVISVIIGEIKKHLRDTGWYVRSPQRVKELSEKISLVKVSLKQELKRNPTTGDLASHLSSTEEKIIEAMETDWEKLSSTGE